MNFRDLSSLANRNSLVIGGAGYLGTPISEVLNELGSNVFITSRNAVSAFNPDTSPVLDSNRFHVFNSDFTTLEGRKSLISFIKSNVSSLDILVNCAWNGEKSSLDLITSEQWDHDINTCLSSVFKITKDFIPFLSNDASIINIASMYGHLSPNPILYHGNKFTNPPSYGAAKAGIIQLTKYLAVFLAPRGIRVNSISPGPFPFPSVQENSEFNDRLSSLNPLGRVGQPHELKGVTALLASNLSSYITGQNFCVMEVGAYGNHAV